MRTLAWIIALLVNCGLVVVFLPGMLNGDIVSAIASALFAGIVALLVSARLMRSPSWMVMAMKVLCVAVPVLALAASLDHGTVSSLEVYSIVFAALLGWGSWRAFQLFSRE